MSISSELLTLQNTKTAIRTAINQKGGSVGASDTFASYATAISNLPTSANKLLTSIDVSDFSGTTFNRATSYITDVTIPSGVTSFGNGAFSSCSALTSITIPNSVTSIEQYCFQNSGLTSITIPSSVTSLGNSICKGCTSLTSATILSNCTSISFFQDCSSLTSVTFGYQGQQLTIEEQCFRNCTSLTTVTIPSNIVNIKAAAFYGCTSLTSVIVEATTPPTINATSNGGAFGNTNDCPIYVPAASVDAYKAASGWSTYASRIYPIQQVATVDGNPVYNYDLGVTDVSTLTDLQVAALPSGDVLEFAEGVAYMQGQIGGYEEVILPSTFTGFSDTEPINAATTTLTSKATTPPSVERNNLGGSGLTAIYVPAASVDTYKAHAAWSGFASIIQAIPVPLMAEITQSDDSVYEIPYDGVGVLDENNVPFDDALAQATDIHITSYATAIGQPYELDGAYYGVFEGDGATNSLETVTIDEGLTAIPNQAFATNLGLTTVTLPSTITSIGDYAFGMSDGSGTLGVMSFTIHATTPPTLGTNAIGVRTSSRPGAPYGKIYVPASAVDTYKAATGWSTWAQYIEAIPSE